MKSLRGVMDDPLFTTVKSGPVYIACLGMFVGAGVLTSFDKPPSDWFHLQMMRWDFWLQVVTAIGDGRFLISACICAAVVLWFKRSDKHFVAALGLLVIIFSGIVTQLLKMSLGRARPFLEQDTRYRHLDFTSFNWFKLDSDFSSFPSGHSTIVFALAWVLLCTKTTWAKRAAVVFVTVLVTLSRVALWKHFFADIIAAAAVGIAASQFLLDNYQRGPLAKFRPAYIWSNK